MAQPGTSIDDKVSSIPIPNIKQGASIRFLDACHTLKENLENYKDKPENLMTLLWKIDKLDLSVPDDSDVKQESESSKKELKSVVSDLQKFYYKSFEASSHIQAFANKMRTQLLRLVVQATDATNEAKAAKILKAAIHLMKQMKSEAEDHEEVATKLRCDAKELNTRVAATQILINRVIDGMQKQKTDLIESINEKREELESREGTKRGVRVGIEVGGSALFLPFGTLARPLMDWIYDQFTSELRDALKELGLNEDSTKGLLECYVDAGEGLDNVGAYLLGHHNFWLEAVGLLDELEREAQKKLETFTDPDLDPETKIIFMEAEQMELLNQALEQASKV